VSNPYLITEPTCISFSGGRTSAYMLRQVLDANGGLPDDAVACFANTGKEEEATLEFVRDCSVIWNVPIVWLEYQDAEETKDRWRIVDFATASRNGEPFEALIRRKSYLPNPVTRFCTVELKIRPMARFLVDRGFATALNQAENMSMIGIRTDEPRRAAKIADKSRIPLFYAGVTKDVVGRFWSEQSFDLNLPNMNGTTVHGNCDLCFLKGRGQIVSLIAEKPSRADWWARMESLGFASKPSGARFRKDRPSYAAMKQLTEDQSGLFNDDSIPCFCGE